MCKNLILFFALLLQHDSFGFNQKNGQIKITSEKLNIDYRIKKAEYIDNVFVNQNKLNIQCDLMKIYYEKSKTLTSEKPKDEIKQIEMFGNVVVSENDNIAKGDKAKYLKETEVMIIEGNASLKNKDGYMEGEHVTYNTKTSKFKITGTAEKNRVRIILND